MWLYIRPLGLSLGLLLGPATAKATEPDKLLVRHGQTSIVSVPGATAAFSLDSSYAEASAEDGRVTVFGKNPGITNILVVVAGAEKITFQVEVAQPEVVIPPDFVRPADPNWSLLGAGMYEFRFASNPSSVQNAIHFARREGDRTIQFRLAGAALIDREPGQSAFSLPTSVLELHTPQRDIAVLDKEIFNSPLTVDGSPIRGMFWREGSWTVHAGYSFYASFANVFLPKQRERVAGITYRHAVGQHSRLTPSFYYFPDEHSTGRRGAVASLKYELEPGNGLNLVAETGYSRGPGAALRLEYQRPDERISATLRYTPKDFAFITLSGLHGRNTDASWSRRGKRLSWDLLLSSNNYVEPTFEHKNMVTTASIGYQLTPSWIIYEGIGYSAFQGNEKLRTLNLPIGIGFNVKHLGVNVQYQYSRNQRRDLGGHQVRTHINWSAGGWRFSGSADRQTHVPAPSYMIAQYPGLQPILDQLGISATTPLEVADLLRDTAVLTALGYADRLHINLSPFRMQYSGTVGWTGARRSLPKPMASALYNHLKTISGGVQNAIYTAAISQRVKDTTELFVSYSMVRHQPDGMPSSYQPVTMVTFRKSFQSSPGFLIPDRHGIISGTVRQDDNATGRCEQDVHGIPGVEVMLDSIHLTRTDKNGRFRFNRVREGEHRLEIRFRSEKPYFFTTPSELTTGIDQTVCFGVGFSLSRIIGYVKNDSGTGLPGLEIEIEGVRKSVAKTDANGRFTVDALLPGVYQVRINPDSVPPGYAVDTLETEALDIQLGAPGRVEFRLKPYRNLSGHVRIFDRISGTYKPAPGVTVLLMELARTTTSGEDGSYLFRDLSPGVHTLVVDYEGTRLSRTVTVEEHPSFLKNVDLHITAPERPAPSPTRVP